MCGDLTKARRNRVLTRKAGATVRPTVAGRRLQLLLRLGLGVKRRRQMHSSTFKNGEDHIAYHDHDVRGERAGSKAFEESQLQ